MTDPILHVEAYTSLCGVSCVNKLGKKQGRLPQSPSNMNKKTSRAAAYDLAPVNRLLPYNQKVL